MVFGITLPPINGKSKKRGHLSKAEIRRNRERKKKEEGIRCMPKIKLESKEGVYVRVRTPFNYDQFLEISYCAGRVWWGGEKTLPTEIDIWKKDRGRTCLENYVEITNLKYESKREEEYEFIEYMDFLNMNKKTLTPEKLKEIFSWHKKYNKKRKSAESARMEKYGIKAVFGEKLRGMNIYPGPTKNFYFD